MVLTLQEEIKMVKDRNESEKRFNLLNDVRTRSKKQDLKRKLEMNSITPFVSPDDDSKHNEKVCEQEKQKEDNNNNEFDELTKQIEEFILEKNSNDFKELFLKSI